VLAVCLGNEGIAFNRYTLDELKSAAEKLRNILGRDPPVPFCTSEPVSQYGQARLREFGDFLAPNIHPVFDKPELSPSAAVAWVRERATALAELSHRPVLVKETGLPHGGETHYTPETQKAFWQHYRSWPRLTRASKVGDDWVSFGAAFEAFNIPWKAGPSNDLKIERFWGLLTAVRKPLPAFEVWQELGRPAPSRPPADRVALAYRFLETTMDEAAHGTVVYRNSDDGLAGFFPSNRPLTGDIKELEFDDHFKQSRWDTCIKISYTPGEKKWAGVFWAYSDIQNGDQNGNWGQVKGRSVKGATQVRFRARGETGSEIIEFLVGGINRPPYNESSHPYQDSFGPLRKLIQLSQQWQEYEIELPEDASLNNVIGGFGFTISPIYNAAINPGFDKQVKGSCIFYLDDITFDDANPDLPRLIRSFVPVADRDSRIRLDVNSDEGREILAGAGVPTRVVQALKPIMDKCSKDDYWFQSEQDFLSELGKLLGDQQTKEYKNLILKYASREDWALRNASHTYDMALTILAFLSRGDGDALRRARILADALVWAQEHDRHYKDRWRNAYSSGPIGTPGSNAVSRIPGFYNGKWFEDRYAVGTDVGNAAWTMLALLSAHRLLEANWKDSSYLRAAKRAAEWIVANYKKNDDFGGFSGGFEGWEKDAGEATPSSPWRSSEHAIDLYAAFLQLAAATKEKRWEQEAIHARNFVMKMWACNKRPAEDGSSKADCSFFWTGIEEGKVEKTKMVINSTVTPLDVQAWSVLAMGHDSEFRRLTAWSGPPELPSWIQWVEEQCRSTLQPAGKIGPFYKFSKQGSGLWFEGTAQMAAVYSYLGKTDEAKKILAEIARLNSVDSPSDDIHHGGGIYAAWKERAWTGFHKYFGLKIGGEKIAERWNYAVRPHVGATAWFLLASNGANPYWLRQNPIEPGKG
jgi:hypothetical protein